MRLTDLQTIEKMRVEGQKLENIYAYTSLTGDSLITIPQYIWKDLRQKLAKKKKFSPFVLDVVLEFFKPKKWHLEEDATAQKNLKTNIQERVEDITTHINAGSKIINKGEKVTFRHLAMLQAMKNSLGLKKNLWHISTFLGTLFLTGLFAGLFLIYLKINQPFVLSSNRKFALLVTVIILTLLFAKLVEFFLLNSPTNFLENIRYPIIVPMAAILVSTLINQSTAAFMTGFLVLVLSISLSFEWEGFMLINTFSSFCALISLTSLKKRTEIILVCGKAFCCSVVVILSLHLYSNTLSELSIASDILSSAGFMLFTAVAVVGMLPIFESFFKVMTDVSLTEYLDPNHPLLKRLTLEAPGTYQHSIVVGNLAEAAALAIGANGLFCRVAALYHDIGKMCKAEYFTENQDVGINPHQSLTPLQSAGVIMSHVPAGIDLAKQAQLPKPLIDIIKEHHGTTLVYFFYHKQLKVIKDQSEKVSQADFRYKGPKPRSKESGIIMIADTFEAASRSVDSSNEDILNELINRLLIEKIEDGQFDECMLSCEDLNVVKGALVKTLLATAHSRVKYPKYDRSLVKSEGK